MNVLPVGTSSQHPPMVATGIDLSPTEHRVRLRYPDWSNTRLRAAIQGYTRFLTSISIGEMRQPSADVDAVWHEHILDTRKYARDCEILFGGFLHHEPANDLCLPTMNKGQLCLPTMDSGQPN